jgi:hypothetical protein
LIINYKLKKIITFYNNFTIIKNYLNYIIFGIRLLKLRFTNNLNNIYWKDIMKQNTNILTENFELSNFFNFKTQIILILDINTYELVILRKKNKN